MTFCGKGGAAKHTNTPSFRWGIVSGACSDVLIIDNIDICIESAAGANREKVVGKRKGKNRARKERKFFSLGAQPGFFAEEEEQWSV